MGSAKTANADRSATLTKPPSDTLFFSHVPALRATFLGAATGAAPTRANRRDEAAANFAASFCLLAPASPPTGHNTRNEVTRISNYEETFNRLNDLRRDDYFPIVDFSS